MIINNKLISNNRSVASMSVDGASITTVSPDGERIPINKKKRTFRNLNHRE